MNYQRTIDLLRQEKNGLKAELDLERQKNRELIVENDRLESQVDFAERKVYMLSRLLERSKMHKPDKPNVFNWELPCRRPSLFG